MTITKEHMRFMTKARQYRIKQAIDSDGFSRYYVQRKRFNKWWSIYEGGDTVLWIFEFIFGEPKKFYEFKDAKDWIMRRLNGKDTIYYYYPFEANNN